MSTLGRAGPRARTGQGSGRGQGCGYAGRGGDALPSCRGDIFLLSFVRSSLILFWLYVYFGELFIFYSVLFYLRKYTVFYKCWTCECGMLPRGCSTLHVDGYAVLVLFFEFFFFSNSSPLVFESWTERVDSEITVFAMSLLDFNMRSLEFSSVKFVLVMTSCAFRVQHQ